MTIKASLSKPFSKIISYQIKKWSSDPLNSQKKIFDKLIVQGQKTLFGKEHDFQNISTSRREGESGI